MVAVTLNLSKELNHWRKGLINIQDSDDIRCLKWSLVRYLNPAELEKLTKVLQENLFFFFNIRNNFQSKFKKILLRDIDLLLTVKKGSSHHVLIRDFNTFMYNQTLHRGRKHFWLYCLQFLSAAQILERHNNNCFEINGK